MVIICIFLRNKNDVSQLTEYFSEPNKTKQKKRPARKIFSGNSNLSLVVFRCLILNESFLSDSVNDQ